MTFLLAMRQRALKQEKLKKLDHDTKVLGDDQIVRTVRIRSTRNPFRTGISWFKREESVSYVAKTCKGGLSIKASLLSINEKVYGLASEKATQKCTNKTKIMSFIPKNICACDKKMPL